MAGKLLFISKGEHAASTRYRALAFVPRLREAGWEVGHISSARKLALLRAAARADVVVVLRRTFSAPLRMLLRHAAKYLVYDIDDAIFATRDVRESPTRRRGFAAMTRLADQVWAGNDWLAEQAGFRNDHVTVLPTAVDPAKYDVTAEKPANTVDLVWIGSSTTRPYLEAALPTLERAPNVRLKIVADFDLKANIETLAVPWSEQGEAEALASSHIGIAPMDDTPWSRGKCGLKVLQYMAAGLPVVSDDVGTNRQIVVHGETGLLASGADAWVDAITRLAGDTTMGAAGRRRVEQHYALNIVAEQMLACLAATRSGARTPLQKKRSATRRG